MTEEVGFGQKVLKQQQTLLGAGCNLVETFYLHLEFKNKRGDWSVNLPFLCSRCGVCCTLDDFLTAGEINATPEEQPEVHAKMKAVSESLGKMWENSESEYDSYIQKNPCPFLLDKSCSIYAIRPDGCRQFPNTLFGMLTVDCEALNRFKKMRTALRKGKTVKETYRDLKDGEHAPARLTEKQLQTCVAKLQGAGITGEELALFTSINQR
jgi:Fe-S-cluster containining protein